LEVKEYGEFERREEKMGRWRRVEEGKRGEKMKKGLGW
jgi:hypothetical protein